MFAAITLGDVLTVNRGVLICGTHTRIVTASRGPGNCSHSRQLPLLPPNPGLFSKSLGSSNVFLREKSGWSDALPVDNIVRTILGTV